MKVQSVIEGILSYHPDLGDRRTCDVVLGANPEVECTGVVVSIAPTVQVIRQAIAAGANLVLVHEPTFYSGYDGDCGWLEGDAIYEAKRALLEDSGIVVYRDHDHIHAHRPDGIFSYVLKQLDWLDRRIAAEGVPLAVELPETSLGELVDHVKQAMGLDTIRYIGDLAARVRTVAFCGHLVPNEQTDWGNNAQVIASSPYDVVIPGETVDWTLPLYIRDAVMLGRAKGMIVPGHFVQEEAGMRWAVEWLRPIVGDRLPVTFVAAGDTFSYR